jgi:plastocyanin
MPQTFTSTALNADSGVVMGGQNATLQVIVPKPGKYRFYSTYHKQQGMKGILVAQP